MAGIEVSSILTASRESLQNAKYVTLAVTCHTCHTCIRHANPCRRRGKAHDTRRMTHASNTHNVSSDQVRCCPSQTAPVTDGPCHAAQVRAKIGSSRPMPNLLQLYVGSAVGLRTSSANLLTGEKTCKPRLVLRVRPCPLPTTNPLLTLCLAPLHPRPTPHTSPR